MTADFSIGYAISWFLTGFLGLELLSVFMHKYLFHGPLWFLHKSHHTPRKGFWEWNDVFSLFFAALSLFLFIGSMDNSLNDFRFWLASGMTTFGAGYFVVHDIFVHKRAMRKWQAPKFFVPIILAHRDHHRSTAKQGNGPYGLLFPKIERAVSKRLAKP